MSYIGDVSNEEQLTSRYTLRYLSLMTEPNGVNP